MTPADPARFDAIARAVHARSLESLSPQVQAQLVQRRRVARMPARPRLTWIWAPALAASLVAVALVLPRMQSPAPTASTSVAAVVQPVDTPPAADEVLAEDPELYLWLASRDATSFAME